MNTSYEQDERGGLPSASATERWMNCPASVALEAQSPVDAGGADAHFGTRVHAALAGELPRAELSTEELATVEATEVVWERARAVLREAGVPIDEARTVVAEHRLWYRDEETMEPLMSGQPDMVLLAGDALVVVEIKSLKAPCHASESWQMRAQAVLVCRNAFLLGIEWARVRRVVPVMLSPNDRPPFTWCMVDAAEVERWDAAIFAALAQVGKPDAVVRSGRWCRYCRARAACAEHLRALDEVGVPELSHALAAWSERHPAGWMELSPAERAARYIVLRRVAEAVRAVLERIEEVVRADLAADPNAYGGALVLDEGRKIRRITDAVAALRVLQEAGLTPEYLVERQALRFALGALEVAYANHVQKSTGAIQSTGCPKDLKYKLHHLLSECLELESQQPVVKIIESNESRKNVR